LRDSRIDLVLLDINMPRMDGFELLERMREENLRVQVPVVMCSTSTYQHHARNFRGGTRGAFATRRLSGSSRSNPAGNPPVF
jgi:CheY-like chemotaxis protein